MVFLPRELATAQAWKLHDYRQRVLSSDPAAGGSCRVTFDQVPQDELWLVDRTVVQSTSSAATVAVLYTDVVDDLHALDGTRVGNFDVADNNSPIQLPGGSQLLIEWTGADDGAVGTARIQLIVLRRDS